MRRFFKLLLNKKYDFSFFLLMSCIFAVGILNLYSAIQGGGKEHLQYLYKTQIMWYMISFGVGFLISFFRPKTFFRYSYAIYFFNCILLLLVLVAGTHVMGAKRWLSIGPFRLQPSEMMKLSAVLALSRWFSRRNPESPVGIKELIIPALMAGIPAVMIIVQPDLGTGLLILLIFSMMTFYRRIAWKVIGILGICALISGGVMYKFGLKDYQRQRITTFLDPWGDALGSGYNAIQSEIAIGSGQIWGKGFKKSSQGSLSYLPENHTDFVFSIYNEEHGLVGAFLLILLYVFYLLRHVYLATAAGTLYESLVVIGCMSILFFHTFINMAMVTGLLPIVGIPLPLVSYGGSSLLTFGVACGLVTSISNARLFFRD